MCFLVIPWAITGRKRHQLEQPRSVSLCSQQKGELTKGKCQAVVVLLQHVLHDHQLLSVRN